MILHELQLPETATVLKVARLRYLGQLTSNGLPPVWALLQHTPAWLEQCDEDVRWLLTYCPEADIHVPLQQTWGTFVSRLTAQPAWWKRLLRKAIQRQVGWHGLLHEWNRWHQQMIPVLQQIGLSPGSLATAQSSQHYCLRCKKVFAKKSFLAVHAFKKHQRVSRARYYVEGKQCSCCLKTFDMHTDLINHVNRQERFEFYSQHGEFVEAQPAVNSRSENRARRTLRDPVLQAEGPRLPFPQGGIDRQIEEKANLFEAWTNALLHPATGLTLLERLRDATLDTVLFHDEILQVFTEWLNRPEVEERLTVAQAAEVSLFFVHASASWFLKQ